MHQIRLHGPWVARLIQKPNSLVDSSTILERERDFLEADGVSVGPVLLEATSHFEETIQLPEQWDRWRSLHAAGPNQAYELSRAFGKPTGLVSGQEVWLVLIANLTCQLWLNGSRLTSDSISELDSNSAGEFRFAIGYRLLARNRLRLLIEIGGSNQPSDCILQSICLEIDEA